MTKEYTIECTSCKTVFVIVEKETLFIDKHPDGYVIQAECPCCKTKILESLF